MIEFEVLFLLGSFLSVTFLLVNTSLFRFSFIVIILLSDCVVLSRSPPHLLSLSFVHVHLITHSTSRKQCPLSNLFPIFSSRFVRLAPGPPFFAFICFNPLPLLLLFLFILISRKIVNANVQSPILLSLYGGVDSFYSS